MGSCLWQVLIGHIATLDMGTSFFLQVALTGFIFANWHDTPENKRRPWMMLTWGALALAMLLFRQHRSDLDPRLYHLLMISVGLNIAAAYAKKGDTARAEAAYKELLKELEDKKRSHAADLAILKITLDRLPAEEYLRPTRVSQWLYSRCPWVYDPMPEIFTSRAATPGSSRISRSRRRRAPYRSRSAPSRATATGEAGSRAEARSSTWIWPIMSGSVVSAWNPPPARAKRAAKLAPATTDGSSTTMGTRTSLPFTRKLVAMPKGSANVPTAFPTILSASARLMPPSSLAPCSPGRPASRRSLGSVPADRGGVGRYNEIIATPVIGPLLEFLDKTDQEHNDGQQATVVLPEFVPAHWWGAILHNQTAWLLKAALLYHRRNLGFQRVIIDVPYYLRD